MADLNSIPTDIYHLFETGTEEINEEALETLATEIKALIRTRLAPPRPRTGGESVLRFSSLGKPDRQLWYMANAGETGGDGPGGKNQLKFLYGDVIEQLMLFLVKQTGHAVSDEQIELEVDGVKGHIDAVIDGVTVDVKSASPMAFAKFQKGALFEDDPFGYIGQISSYASIVTPDTGGAFLAFDKVHGDIAILNIGPTVTNDYGVQRRIDHLREVLGNPEKPRRCYSDEADGKSGNRKLGTQCSYCAFKFDCWKDANDGAGIRTFLYSGKPRFLTAVYREPDVYEVKPNGV